VECHGRTTLWLRQLVKLGLVVPNAETCTLLCHNEKSPFVGKGYVFKFEERKAQGTHVHVALRFSH
jgi:hypothetical protein